jgi:hypothetical protein
MKTGFTGGPGFGFQPADVVPVQAVLFYSGGNPVTNGTIASVMLWRLAARVL